MSLYQCIDYIDSYLEHPETHKFNLFQKIFNRARYDKSLSHVDEKFLNTLKDMLSRRTREDYYSKLCKEIQCIENYFALRPAIPEKNGLRYILEDLKSIQKQQEDLDKQPRYKPSNKYSGFQNDEYRKATLNQDRSFRLGNSPGACYGFTLSMVDPKTSPYNNPNVTDIKLNQKVHNYQKNESNRKKDQGNIKRTRMTREHFTPDARKQAEKIYAYANEHEGKEFLLTRRASVGSHACYMSKQKNDGKFRYTDPNHGVYLFKNKKDFVDFYDAAAREDKKAGMDFRFYQIDELRHDPRKALVESKTVMGKVRTLLTGNKYDDGHRVSVMTTRFIYGAAGMGIGAVIGGAIGSVVPVIGTTMGAMLGGIIGGYGGTFLTLMAAARGHQGLLGVPHLIQDKWYDFKQGISNIFSRIMHNTPQSEMPHEEEIEVNDPSSSAKILSNLSPKATINPSVEEKSSDHDNDITSAYQDTQSTANDTSDTETMSEVEEYETSPDCKSEQENYNHSMRL